MRDSLPWRAAIQERSVYWTEWTIRTTMTRNESRCLVHPPTQQTCQSPKRDPTVTGMFRRRHLVSRRMRVTHTWLCLAVKSSLARNAWNSARTTRRRGQIESRLLPQEWFAYRRPLETLPLSLTGPKNRRETASLRPSGAVNLPGEFRKLSGEPNIPVELSLPDS